MSETEKKEAALPPPPPPEQDSTDDKSKGGVVPEGFEAAVEEGGEKGLKNAFKLLSKEAPTARVEGIHIQRALAKRRKSQEEAELSIQHVDEMIKQFSEEGQFNCDEFVDIIRLLEEPGEADLKAKIYGELTTSIESGGSLTLHGKNGVGKTWLAREVANRAVRKGEFDFAIWVYLNRIYDDLSLRESIAYQLYVLAAVEESEAEEDKNEKEKSDETTTKKKKKEPKEEEKEEATKETKRRKKMEKYINGAIWEKRILFILDSQGSRMRASLNPKEKIVKSGDDGKVETKEELKCVLELKLEGDERVVEEDLEMPKSHKVLITTSEASEKDKNIMVKPFSWEDSKALASAAMEREKVVEKAEKLAHYFMFRSQRLPSELLLITRIVAYFAKEESGLQKLINAKLTLRKVEGAKVLDVLIKINTLLPTSVLIDCYSTEKAEDHFLSRGRKVSFNALICYWIMEGHLGGSNRVEDAYVEGHRIVIELLNCGLLQKQESDYVVATGAVIFHLDIWDYERFFRNIRPGLAVTFDFRLGQVALADGMIRSTGRQSQPHVDQSERDLNTQRKTDSLGIISTVFLDGNRISEEEHIIKSLKEHKCKVEVVAIKDPTCQHFDLPFGEMQKLRLLALRGCQFLCNLDKFLGDQKLEHLSVLEISGATSVKEIPDRFFENMTNLKTLNMSKLHEVELLPRSFYSLTKLEFLILRECKKLRELGSIKTFKALKVLDVSDATSFEKFEDKSLHENNKLQVLNVSNTKLKTLPLINKLPDLKFVFLRDCAELPRIRKIDQMSKLQIFDIAGAKAVERFCDPSLEDLHSLVIVDISGTAIRRLPANIADPTYLYANNCRRLKTVPPIEGLSKLQVLRLSGCERLTEVRTEFFSNITGCLIELDLSKTKVTELPFLASLHILRRLLLSECKELEKLKGLSNLGELEVLDLSGCKKVTELEEGSFENMKHLQHLNLSGTGIGGDGKPLPSLSKLKRLKELYVRDCPNLTKLPGVEELQSSVLDCSGTLLDLDQGPHVVGTGVKSITADQLFQNLGATQPGNVDANWDPNFTYKQVSHCKWNVSNWPVEETKGQDSLGKLVYGAHFLRLLEKYPSFLQKNLSTFWLLFYPSEARFDDKFKASYRYELSLRDIYFEQVCEKVPPRCLEIHGFAELPESLRPMISKVEPEFVVLVDDMFLRSLVDDLGINIVERMKACWIERCNELKHVVAAVEKVKEGEKPGDGDKKHGGGTGEMVKGEGNQRKKKVKEIATEKEGDAGKSEGNQQKTTDAEKAGESAKNEGDGEKNAASEEKTRSEGGEEKNTAEEKGGESATNEGDKEKNAVADTSETKVKTEGNEQKNAAEEKGGEPAKNEGEKEKDAATDTSKTKAKSEGDEQKNVADKKTEEPAKDEGEKEKDAATDTSKTKAKSEGDEQKNVADKKTEEPAKTTTTTAAAAENSKEELKNPADDLKSLEILWISDNLMLESILRGDRQSISFKLLNTIYIEYCPKLSEICSSSSQLPRLKKLYIKYCPNLKRLFGDDDHSPKLDNLKNLQLWGLNSLKRIGCKAPNLDKLRIGQCPLLEHAMPSRVPKAEAKDTKDEAEEHAMEAEDIKHETEGHECLRVLHIKSCDKLTSIFESGEEAHFEMLKELELWGLPKLEKVAQEAPKLRVLRVGDCPSLESVIARGDGVSNIKTVEVKSCEKMKRIFGGGESDQLKNVKKIELVGLPVLEMLGAKLPGGGEGEGEGGCEIWACPKLKDEELKQWNEMWKKKSIH